MANPDLPEDMLLEIFLRLPTKSVGKFRCLSRTWEYLLSTKHFINSHLNRLKTRQELEQKFIFINSVTCSLHMVTISMKKIRKIDIIGKNWAHLWGSCNGLVLILSRNFKNTCVLNPVTRKHVQIPYPDEGFLHEDYSEIFGFGYDSSCDDYKVLRISEYFAPDELGHYFFDVYSLRERFWRRVVVVNDIGPYADHQTSAGEVIGRMSFVNGALHWAVKDFDSRYHINAVDLATETFHRVKFPKEVECSFLFELTVLKGCLSAIWFNSGYVDLWMMMKYRVVDSCVRFRFGYLMMREPICFVGEEELLCMCINKDNSLVLWDCREEMAKIISEGRIPFSIMSGYHRSVLVETLVSPEQGNEE